MAKKKIETSSELESQAYTVEALMRDGRWNNYLLVALLDKNKTYTIEAVDKIVSDYMKGEK